MKVTATELANFVAFSVTGRFSLSNSSHNRFYVEGNE